MPAPQGTPPRRSAAHGVVLGVRGNKVLARGSSLALANMFQAWEFDDGGQQAAKSAA